MTDDARQTPLVPPDTEAIEWARELDRAARRHDDARTQSDRDAASQAINNLILDDERMVQIARALLAAVGDASSPIASQHDRQA